MKYLLTACTFVLTLMVGAQSQSPLDTIVMMKGIKAIIKLLKIELFINLIVVSEKTIKQKPKRKIITLNLL